MKWLFRCNNIQLSPKSFFFSLHFHISKGDAMGHGTSLPQLNWHIVFGLCVDALHSHLWKHNNLQSYVDKKNVFYLAKSYNGNSWWPLCVIIGRGGSECKGGDKEDGVRGGGQSADFSWEVAGQAPREMWSCNSPQWNVVPKAMMPSPSFLLAPCWNNLIPCRVI